MAGHWELPEYIYSLELSPVDNENEEFIFLRKIDGSTLLCYYNKDDIRGWEFYNCSLDFHVINYIINETNLLDILEVDLRDLFTLLSIYDNL